LLQVNDNLNRVDNMPDNPVNEVNPSTVLALLTDIDQRMREGFAALIQEQKTIREEQKTIREEQKTIREEQKTIREEQQALRLRVEDGFAVASQERRALRENQDALSKRMEDGFAAAAREQQALRESLQTLSKRVEDGFALAAKEQQALREHQQLLSVRIEAGFALEARERQAVSNKLDALNQWLHKELSEDTHILSKMTEKVQSEFADFKREKSAHDKDVLQRLSRLETAQSLN
jgi:predicted  nucleic acid-binding Zn-ribbon protein